MSLMSGAYGSAESEGDSSAQALQHFFDWFRTGITATYSRQVDASEGFRVADHARVLRYTPIVHNEHALIAAFVKRSKRDRYRQILSKPRLRHKFTDQLAHFTDFDPKYRLRIPSNKLFVGNAEPFARIYLSAISGRDSRSKPVKKMLQCLCAGIAFGFGRAIGATHEAHFLPPFAAATNR